jgi:2-dehydropantoate 2-reductase
MKVSFLGAGAIGAMFGALLRRSQNNLDVHLIVRGAFGEAAIRNQYVEIVGPWGKEKVPVHCSSDCNDIARSDIVFVTVKSQDTRSILEEAKPYLGDAIVVSIQNGINDATFDDFVPRNHQVMGMTTTNMAVVQPGQVSMQLDGTTLFGGPHGSPAHEASHRVANLFQNLRVPGLSFGVHENILGIRYNKLAINALGYASCLSNSNFINEAIGSANWRRYVGKPIIRECRSILEKADIRMERIPGRSDLSRIERLMSLMEIPLLGTVLRTTIRRRFEKSPIVFSLLQDLRRGKLTEVDSINGQFVALAQQIGCEAPINQAIVSLTREIEGSQNPRFFAQDEVIRRAHRK